MHHTRFDFASSGANVGLNTKGLDNINMPRSSDFIIYKKGFTVKMHRTRLYFANSGDNGGSNTKGLDIINMPRSGDVSGVTNGASVMHHARSNFADCGSQERGQQQLPRAAPRPCSSRQGQPARLPPARPAQPVAQTFRFASPLLRSRLMTICERILWPSTPPKVSSATAGPGDHPFPC